MLEKLVQRRRKKLELLHVILVGFFPRLQKDLPPLPPAPKLAEFVNDSTDFLVPWCRSIMSLTPLKVREGGTRICTLSEVQYFILTVVSSFYISILCNHVSAFHFCKSTILSVLLECLQYFGVLYFLLLYILMICCLFNI